MSLCLLDLIKGRRSIQKYSSRRVSRNALYRILEAARWAPSAHNAQPWRFIIITKSGLRRGLVGAMAYEWMEDMTRDGVPPENRERLVKASIERFIHAPVLMIACVTMKDMDRYGDKRRREGERIMAAQSLAVALQNVLLATHSEGLGACWFCAPLFCKDAVRRILKMPDDADPQALITLGYPFESPDPPPRKPIEEIAYENYWGEST